MQKFEVYYDELEAVREMRKEASKGWRVYTCTMSTVSAGFSSSTRVIVVYEKDDR